ncbi:MAG: 50S ribosomal protein L18 [Candidatus Omnitrophica bacterium]|nr:50S ribosomal protein L18 [Candidatus Omnitrophota bacterium]
MLVKVRKRIARHERIRKVVSGTLEQPRLCVHRSAKNFFAQLIDDSTGKVIVGLSTLNKELRGKIKNGGNTQAAGLLGEAFGSEIKKKGIEKIAFDRGGYLYHGRVKAFAEGARKAGIKF